MPRFQNKDGSLTPYAFACGYIQTNIPNWADAPHKPFVELFRDGVWHVKRYLNNERTFWECYDTLTDARKAFKQQCKL